MNVLAFDPSMHATGWAFFENSEYCSSGVLKVPRRKTGMMACFAMWEEWEELGSSEEPFLRFMPIDAVVVEVQEHRRRNDRSDPNNLMMLNGICFAFLFGVVADHRIALTPKQWKGTVPKAIFCSRIAKEIGRTDITDDNELDAIGLGLHFFRRKHVFLGGTKSEKSRVSTAT